MTLDMWEEMKKNKKITLWIDGRSYTQTKVSVFNPEDVSTKSRMNFFRILKTSYIKHDMKTRQYVLAVCKNKKRKITVKCYLWGKLWLLTAGKIFRGSGKKRGGKRDEKSKF